jgi:hypothetical protein
MTQRAILWQDRQSHLVDDKCHADIAFVDVAIIALDTLDHGQAAE